MNDELLVLELIAHLDDVHAVLIAGEGGHLVHLFTHLTVDVEDGAVTLTWPNGQDAVHTLAIPADTPTETTAAVINALITRSASEQMRYRAKQHALAFLKRKLSEPFTTEQQGTDAHDEPS